MKTKILSLILCTVLCLTSATSAFAYRSTADDAVLSTSDLSHESEDIYVGTAPDAIEDADGQISAAEIPDFTADPEFRYEAPAPVPAEDSEELPEDVSTEKEEAVGATVGLGVASHTQAEIRSYMKSSGVSVYAGSTYANQPNTTAGSYDPGRLSDESMQNTLGVFNLIRYIAGLNYDITLNDNYIELAQASAFVNYLNGGISHSPEQPEGVSEELYEKACKGSGSSNLSYGYASFGAAIVNGQMADASSASNLQTVGHRRWILYPDLTMTGLGQVGRFYTLYVFDFAGQSSAYNVAWPAQNMPVEFFGSSYPWSINTNDYESISDIQVILTRRSDNETWTFSESDSDGLFNVDNNGYGKIGCIIFRPDNISYNAGDVFDVTIKGAKKGTISYTVSFFELFAEDITPTPTNTPTSAPSRKFFDDVQNPSHPYYDAIYWAVDHGITTGYSGTNLFGINDACTRSQAMMFLWRMAGKPEPNSWVKNPFSDITPSHPHYKAVMWAYQNTIAKGFSNGTYGVNVPCTRGQIMTFIWRYAGCQPPKSNVNPFKDALTPAYRTAILWGNELKITHGYSDGTFRDNEPCTRGQIVTFLYRIKNWAYKG